ncbi:MAG TPA: multicopper oxidase domain-containing protein, partial [Lacipirellulaceae bacterium]|nr:multicopper oxidase domain-containing protein [Lacipirellulaceae bacterium]
LYEVGVTQFQQQLHSQLAPTTLWGYNGMFPGPTFDVSRGELIKVRWTNNLRDANGAALNHFLPYDNTLHGAAAPDDGSGHSSHGGAALYPQARIVTHLHGGVVDEQSDGYPEHWFTPNPAAAANGLGGPAGNAMVTTYPNDQRASTMWYHDHAMASTRLNVYAGMAGFYINRDAAEQALNLPAGKYEAPLLLQDRSFYENGQLYYPGSGSQGEPVGHTQAFFGDVNLVNGKVWPFMEVEPRKYRFRLLNGANSRAYNLSLVPDAGAASTDPLTIHQIGTDGGLFAQRVDRLSVALSAADRADVIVDFSQFAPGDTLRLLNSGPQLTAETDEVMQFRVIPGAGPDLSSLPTNLVPVPRYEPADAVVTRKLRLTRSFDSDGQPRMLLDGKLWSDAVSEVLTLGEPEIWEISNRTPDDHPIHLHLEAFQLLGRSTNGGVEIPLQPYELGWEDTVNIPAQQTARFMVNFEKYTGQFVWHCHLLEHEDHEMMRPFRVEVPEPGCLALGAPLLAAAGVVARARRPRRSPR